MTLTLLKGQQACVLKLEDLKRYPGSLLATVASAVESQGSTFRVDEVPDSPLAAWEKAFNITTALYRGNHKSLMVMLSELLTTHTTADLHNKLKALVDYLNLPEPLFELLPPIEMTTIQQLPLLDLYYYAASKHAVDLMINAGAFGSSGGINAWKANAACFFLGIREDKGLLKGINVYAVHGTSCMFTPAAWAPASQRKISNHAGHHVTLKAKLLGGTADRDVEPLLSVSDCDATNDTFVLAGIAADHKYLGRHIGALLQDALRNITLPDQAGRKVAVQSKCVAVRLTFDEEYVSPTAVYLWVIHW